MRRLRGFAKSPDLAGRTVWKRARSGGRFQLVEVRSHFARYLVDQTIDGVTRMHFVEYIENGGRWSMASF